MGIKKEAVNDDYQNVNTNRDTAPITETSASEKQKLLKAFSALKSDNQKVTFDLKKKTEECAKLCSEKHELKQEVTTAKDKINELESTLSRMKHDQTKKFGEYEQKIAELVHQNKILSARVKQIQTGINERDNHNESIKNCNSTDDYEVEKLIDDQVRGKKRYFLVRWAGYGPEDDTWESEKNLSCPDILKDYLQKKH